MSYSLRGQWIQSRLAPEVEHRAYWAGHVQVAAGELSAR
jgi:hypothetical protein